MWWKLKSKKVAVENGNGYTSWTEVKWKLLELEMKGKNHQVVKNIVGGTPSIGLRRYV